MDENENSPYDPEMLAQGYLCIQREIFSNLFCYFFINVREKNSNLFKRADDFSKDFNNCPQPDITDLKLTPENYADFCNYAFDFMNYVRKIENSLFQQSINYAKSQMYFVNMPTLAMSVEGCAASIGHFLDMRENFEELK